MAGQPGKEADRFDDGFDNWHDTEFSQKPGTVPGPSRKPHSAADFSVPELLDEHHASLMYEAPNSGDLDQLNHSKAVRTATPCNVVGWFL